VTRPHPSSLASALRPFLTDYLPRQLALSPHTQHSYRDSLKLLLQFVAGKKADPGRLTMEHLTYERVMAFLLHLETGRNNQVSTRNVRLGAIRSFFRFVGVHYPEHLALAQRILFEGRRARAVDYRQGDALRAARAPWRPPWPGEPAPCRRAAGPYPRTSTSAARFTTSPRAPSPSTRPHPRRARATRRAASPVRFRARAATSARSSSRRTRPSPSAAPRTRTRDRAGTGSGVARLTPRTPSP